MPKDKPAGGTPPTTPGPWKMSASSHRVEWSYWIDGPGEDALVAAVAVRNGPPQEMAANAALIAAAPDLLAALEAVEDDCMDRGDSLLWAALGTQIRAALAKVRP